jgi:CDP-4-dehydro-6-deoxyglucose reductase
MTFKISLRNNKIFDCDSQTVLFEAAKNKGVLLEHSCLTARCRSCIVRVIEGETVNKKDELVLSEEEKLQGYILSCNAKPLSNLKLDIEDLGDVILSPPKTIPSKIDSIIAVSKDVIKLSLRFPPNNKFEFLAGQYVNLIKGNIKRSYSIANCLNTDSKLEFLIKNYQNGLMSNYLFKEAKLNDLLRLEGPLGTFFYRKSSLNTLVFLATGTGIAPIKAIIEELMQNSTEIASKKIFVLWGGRYIEDFYWEPNFTTPNFHFIPVLSRENDSWSGEKGYVQDIILQKLNSFNDTQVYACGSNKMIKSARSILIKNGLPESQFYSDAFVSSN